MVVVHTEYFAEVSRSWFEADPTIPAKGLLLAVRHGETARAELGAKGRPVVAKIALPPSFDPKGGYAANSQFEI